MSPGVDLAVALPPTLETPGPMATVTRVHRRRLPLWAMSRDGAWQITLGDLPHHRSRSTQRGGSPVGRALGTTRPHALAPLAVALMGLRDP
jgi:hypothetical protein